MTSGSRSRGRNDYSSRNPLELQHLDEHIATGSGGQPITLPGRTRYRECRSGRTRPAEIGRNRSGDAQ